MSFLYPRSQGDFKNHPAACKIPPTGQWNRAVLPFIILAATLLVLVRILVALIRLYSSSEPSGPPVQTAQQASELSPVELPEIGGLMFPGDHSPTADHDTWTY